MAFNIADKAAKYGAVLLALELIAAPLNILIWTYIGSVAL